MVWYLVKHRDNFTIYTLKKLSHFIQFGIQSIPHICKGHIPDMIVNKAINSGKYMMCIPF